MIRAAATIIAIAVCAWLLWPVVARAESPRLALDHACAPAALVEARLAALGYAFRESSRPGAAGDWVERWAHRSGLWILLVRIAAHGLSCFLYEGAGWTAAPRPPKRTAPAGVEEF